MSSPQIHDWRMTCETRTYSSAGTLVNFYEGCVAVIPRKVTIFIHLVAGACCKCRVDTHVWKVVLASQAAVKLGKRKSVDAAVDKASEYRGLAELIALEYTNIPRATVAEAISEAYHALVRASAAFDPEKGDFAPFAARAIRNALNSLYAKQLRLARVFPKSLDEAPRWHPTSEISSGGSALIARVKDSSQDVRKHVRRRETLGVITEVMGALTPREQLIVSSLRDGRSLAETGRRLGISKQAVHKASTGALRKLRTLLEGRGFSGTDSQGFLRSSVPRKRPRRVDDSGGRS